MSYQKELPYKCDFAFICFRLVPDIFNELKIYCSDTSYFEHIHSANVIFCEYNRIKFIVISEINRREIIKHTLKELNNYNVKQVVGIGITSSPDNVIFNNDCCIAKNILGISETRQKIIVAKSDYFFNMFGLDYDNVNVWTNNVFYDKYKNYIPSLTSNKNVISNNGLYFSEYCKSFKMDSIYVMNVFDNNQSLTKIKLSQKYLIINILDKLSLWHKLSKLVYELSNEDTKNKAFNIAKTSLDIIYQDKLNVKFDNIIILSWIYNIININDYNYKIISAFIESKGINTNIFKNVINYSKSTFDNLIDSELTIDNNIFGEYVLERNILNDSIKLNSIDNNKFNEYYLHIRNKFNKNKEHNFTNYVKSQISKHINDFKTNFIKTKYGISVVDKFYNDFILVINDHLNLKSTIIENSAIGNIHVLSYDIHTLCGEDIIDIIVELEHTIFDIYTTQCEIYDDIHIEKYYMKYKNLQIQRSNIKLIVDYLKKIVIDDKKMTV